MRRLPLLGLLCLGALCSAAFGLVGVKYVRIQGPRELDLLQGQSLSLTALAYDADWNPISDDSAALSLSWSSSAGAVRVERLNNQSARIHAVAPGRAEVAVRSSSASDAVSVVVRPRTTYLDVAPRVLERLSRFNEELARYGMALGFADLDPAATESAAFQHDFRLAWNASPSSIRSIPATSPIAFSRRQEYADAARPGVSLTLPDSARGDLLSVSFEYAYTWAELSKLLGREATRGSVPDVEELFRALTLTFQGAGTGDAAYAVVGRGGVPASEAEAAGALSVLPDEGGVTIKLTAWLANLQAGAGPRLLHGLLLVPDGTADGTLGGTMWTTERPSAQSGKAGGSGGGCAGTGSPATLALAGWLLLRCSRKGR